MEKNYIDFNEKTTCVNPVLYVALMKVDLVTNEKTEVRRIYRKADLVELIEQRVSLNRQHIDDKEYYITITLVDEKATKKKQKEMENELR